MALGLALALGLGFGLEFGFGFGLALTSDDSCETTRQSCARIAAHMAIALSESGREKESVGTISPHSAHAPLNRSCSTSPCTSAETTSASRHVLVGRPSAGS